MQNVHSIYILHCPPYSTLFTPGIARTTAAAIHVVTVAKTLAITHPPNSHPCPSSATNSLLLVTLRPMKIMLSSPVLCSYVFKNSHAPMLTNIGWTTYAAYAFSANHLLFHPVKLKKVRKKSSST